MKQKKVVITDHGSAGRLELVDAEIPNIKDSELLLRVEYAGVAFADIMMRHGRYPGQPKPPFTPGFDVVGVVERSASNAHVKTGTRVAALTRYGGYAQYVVVDAVGAVPVPDEVPPEKAVCLVLNYLTAYRILRRVCSLDEGAAVLVHSAAGGVGTAALQIGRNLKLQMFGTASASKHEVVRGLGGVPIDYHSEDFVEFIAKAAPRGLDAVLDPIGPSNWRRSQRVLKRGGTLVAFGGLAMHDRTRDVMKDGTLSMVTTALWLKLFSRARLALFDVTAGKPEERRTDLATLLEQTRERQLDPIVARVLPLSCAREAHQLLGSGEVIGKLVLDCRQEAGRSPS